MAYGCVKSNMRVDGRMEVTCFDTRPHDLIWLGRGIFSQSDEAREWDALLFKFQPIDLNSSSARFDQQHTLMFFLCKTCGRICLIRSDDLDPSNRQTHSGPGTCAQVSRCAPKWFQQCLYHHGYRSLFWSAWQRIQSADLNAKVDQLSCTRTYVRAPAAQSKIKIIRIYSQRSIVLAKHKSPYAVTIHSLVWVNMPETSSPSTFISPSNFLRLRSYP